MVDGDRSEFKILHVGKKIMLLVSEITGQA